MTTPREEFFASLVEHGFWLPSGVPGVHGRTERFEVIVRAFDAIVVDLARQEGATRVEFPPVIDREILRRMSYMESFPELCGSIHSYREARGAHLDLVDRVDAQGDWSEYLEQMPVVLCPAACYPLYPTLTGTLSDDGGLFDLSAYVFRSEPSDDPARLQSFRMRENVRVGQPHAVRAWRDGWSERALALLRELGLKAEREVANDPFFGRGGRLLAANQIAEALKFEVLVPITSESEPTAVCSFNYHEDKFGSAFGIELPDGSVAHSACLGFGLERVALALIETHGFDLSGWPDSVRERLGL